MSGSTAASAAIARGFEAASCAIAAGLVSIRWRTARRIRWASARTLSTCFLRRRRTCLPLLWLIRCDDPHFLWLTLPVADTLNRFFIPL